MFVHNPQKHIIILRDYVLQTPQLEYIYSGSFFTLSRFITFLKKQYN